MCGLFSRPLLERVGVRGRLLLAFFGISAFSVIAAMAAFYSFAEVGSVLGRITRERVPSALASLELSREVERIVSAAPSLLAVSRHEQFVEVSGSIAVEVARTEELLGTLEGSGIAAPMLASIEARVDSLKQNLNALDDLVSRRFALANQRKQQLRRLTEANSSAQRLVTPAIVLMDSKLARWRREKTNADLDPNQREEQTRRIAEDISIFLPQQKVQIEVAAINENLIKAAGAPERADLPLLAFPLKRSLNSLAQLVWRPFSF